MKPGFGLCVLVLTFASCPDLGAQDRLPPIPDAKLTEAQKKAVAEYAAVRPTD
jgi:hypothetical protein